MSRLDQPDVASALGVMVGQFGAAMQNLSAQVASLPAQRESAAVAPTA
jgi:hypothetical protein